MKLCFSKMWVPLFLSCWDCAFKENSLGNSFCLLVTLLLGECRGNPLPSVSSVAQSCLTLRPRGLQHARPPYPSLSPWACSRESVMPSNRLILSRPLLLLPSIFPSIKVFSNESLLRIRWPKYWSFSFSSSPSNDYSRLISFMIDWFNLLLKIPGMWIPGIHQKHLLITQRLVCQTHCSKREHLQIKWS